MRKRLIPGLAIMLAAAAIALLAGRLGLLTGLENITWQWRVQHFAAPESITDQVRIIALDQQSLDWGRRENHLSWPWPRQAYEILLAFCQRAGARAVVMDLLFSEPSLYGAEDDLALGRAMREHGRVVVGHTLSESPGPPESELSAGDPAPAPQGLIITGYGQWRQKMAQGLTVYRQPAAMPVPEIAGCAAMLANISDRPDADGTFRRVSLVADLAGKPLPSAALAAWLTDGDRPMAITASGKLQIGSREVPLDGRGKTVLNFRGPAGTIPTVSAAAVIQSELRLQAGEAPEVDPARFGGKYVFFGLTAPGLLDLRATPQGGVYSGVEIHATMLDNLLAGDFMQDTEPAINILLLLLWTSLAVAVLFRCRRAWQSGLALPLMLPWPLLAGVFAYGQGFWLPVAEPTAAVLLAITGALLFNFATEGRKKRFVKQAFSRYLHPAVIEQLVSQPERLRLGGERRELSIFFSDLQGFTTIAESLDPERLTRLLNEYLSAMTDCLLAAGGTIDKYEGDAIIAFWNAPLDQPDHACRAVRAALQCQARLDALRPELALRFGCELRMRIGINTGQVVVGNLGSAQRFDYSILGDGANIAARLEGVNKQFGTPILISEACRRQLPDSLPVREIGRVRVVGRREPIRIFEPLAAPPAWLDRFQAALRYYYQGEFAAALDLFSALAALDPAAASYAARCRGLVEEPPTAWEGVWNMSGK